MSHTTEIVAFLLIGAAIIIGRLLPGRSRRPATKALPVYTETEALTIISNFLNNTAVQGITTSKITTNTTDDNPTLRVHLRDEQNVNEFIVNTTNHRFYVGILPDLHWTEENIISFYGTRAVYLKTYQAA